MLSPHWPNDHLRQPHGCHEGHEAARQPSQDSLSVNTEVPQNLLVTILVGLMNWECFDVTM